MSSLNQSDIFLTKKRLNFICSICNHSFTNNSHLTRHIKKTHNKETEGFLCKFCNQRFYHQIHEKNCILNPLVQYEIFIKENEKFIENFIQICDDYKVKNLNYFINIFNEVYDKDIENFKNFLFSLYFISKEHFDFYLKNYNDKINIEKVNLLKFLNLKNISNDNLEYQKKENLFINKKQELKTLIEEHYLNKRLKKSICLHCLKYFNNVGDHIFRIREKKSTCCEIVRKNILNVNTLNEQLDFFVELIKYTRKKTKNQSNEEIKENIRKILKKNKDENKINDKKSIIDICEKLYSFYFKKYKKNSPKKKIKIKKTNLINSFKKENQIQDKKVKKIENEIEKDKTEWGTEQKIGIKSNDNKYNFDNNIFNNNNNEDDDFNIHQLTIKNQKLDDFNFDNNNVNSEFEMSEEEKLNESYILIIKSILEKKYQLFNDNMKNIPILYQKKIQNLILNNNPFNNDYNLL